MNIIQTLHIHSNKVFFSDSFGWAAPEYHLMGWALSFLQLQKIYGSITLYANRRAAHLLIDTLQLPHTGVNLALDQLTLIHPDLWAFPKIYTYSLQEQPFLHIDGDVFLFSPLNSDLLKGELIAQNVEVATGNFYGRTQNELIQNFSYFPTCVKKDFKSGIPVNAVNAGILGGHNINFFRDYATLAFDYINKNSKEMSLINVNNFNVFLEQHLFYALSKEKNIPVSVLFEGIIEDRGYKNMGDFHDVPFNRTYLHLLGHYKRDEFTCIKMADKLKELYPDYYERIVSLFHKKNIRLSPSGFNNKTDSSSKRIDEESNSHLRLLRFVVDNYYPESEKELFQSDFEKFYSQLINILTEKKDTGFLHERDLSARYWYRNLFADLSCMKSHRIIRSNETEIIESSFNWAGLFNKHYRSGTDYYSDLLIRKGEYYNLVVYEDSDNGFSLYDMDEIDYSIFQLLEESLSIKELIEKMQIFFEDDVLKNHYEVYENLILSSIKQLVIKKAIQPVYDNLQ